MSKLKPVDPKANFPEMEQEVLKFWEANRIFDKTLEKTKNGKPFVFFEGPPTANAKPALHHVEARAFKDLIPRYQTMKGRLVQRKAGWDTHGLPVELQIEKALGISGKKQIESIKPTVRESIIEFNRLCKESVWQYKEEWEKLTTRMGFWVDLENPYITYHNSYIESVWWILKQVWDKGLVYLGHKVVHYCPRCGTALASHEVAQGYQTDKDTSVFMKFKVREEGRQREDRGDTYILSWTTTPWTLPGNVALAVGENIEYSKIQVGEEKWILATERLGVVSEEYKVLEKMKGKDLLGWEYEPLFNVKELQSEKSYKVYPADFVTTTDGTGVVHTAVMYGIEDYELGEQIGLPKFHTVDESGKFVPAVGDLAGMYVKDKKTEEKVFEHLKAKGNFLRTEVIEHEYPHCWRCGTALLYYARDSWFIKMSQFRSQLLENNELINWVPDYIKHGRFGEWLTDAKDWAISRERYWGTPLPIWQCDECQEFQMIGSVKELGLNNNTFYFGRHGEAETNILGIHSNYPEIVPRDLTKHGMQMAEDMGKRLKAEGGVDMIFASDILRTKHTAEIVGQVLGLEVKFDERLREYNLGIFNGKPLADFKTAFPPAKRWQEAPEGGETYEQLQNRILDFVREMNEKYQDKKILVITHGDVIWLLSQYYDNSTTYPRPGEFFEVAISIPDLHRPYIDDVVLKCPKCGKNSHRIAPVLDVWFDSGAMPFAQWHYPFQNRDLIEGTGAQFPADYISEAIDQTRGWFYTLLAISTLLDKGAPYQNVINLGHLLDAKGQKMSKSKGNVVDPWEIINEHGVDALRWFMYSVNQPGDSKLFNGRDIQLIVRKNFLTLWNTLSFLSTYANHDGWTPQATANPSEDILDQWIEAKMRQLVYELTENLDHYDVFRSARAVEEFINDLSTWYVRRSRERKGAQVYQTLYDVLKKLARLMAPFTPFLAESVWQALKQDNNPESVHLADWPEAKPLSDDDKNLLMQMDRVRQIVESGHALRKSLAIKVRQPLAAIRYSDKMQLSEELEAVAADELNVKSVVFVKADSFGVEFDSVITPELKIEGLARELERAVQEIRKKSGLKVGETVNLSYHTKDDELIAAFKLFDRKKTYIAEINSDSDGDAENLEIDGKQVALRLNRA